MVVNDLSTGTHYVHAVWPGESNYGEVTTIGKSIKIDILSGFDIGGIMTLSITPASNSLVVGEGTATITAVMTTSTNVPGVMEFYNGQTPLGTVPLVFNEATINVDTLPAGDLDIIANWSGSIINGVRYAGKSTSTVYTVKSGTNINATLGLTLVPSYGILNEGDLTLTATINTSTQLPGNITFYANDAVVYTAPVESNSAILTVPNNYSTGTSTFQVTYDGNQESHPRYVPLISSVKNWQVYARDTVGGPTGGGPEFLTLAIAPKPSAFLVQTSFVATFNTSTQIEGTVSFVDTGVYSGIIGTAPIVNNQASFLTASLSTGTHNIYAYYPGSSSAPKFYPIKSATQSLVVEQGVQLGVPLVLTVSSDNYLGSGEPYVAGETTFLVAAANTTTTLTGTVQFYQGSSLIGSANITGNAASTSTVFATTGSRTLRAIWGGQLIGGKYYADQTTAPVTINVIQGYTLPSAITVSASSPRIVDENITFRATASTSTQLANTVTFYANNVEIGKANFVVPTNTATLVTTLSSTGTFVLRADWVGGYVQDQRFYLPKTGTTSSITVASAQTLGGQFNLTVDVIPQVRTLPSIFTATLTTSTSITGVDGGVVTFKDSTSSYVYGTSTFISNKATLISVPNNIPVGIRRVQAVWGGKTVAPKYFGTSSNVITQSILEPSDITTTLTINPNPFRIYNQDRTTNNSTAATINVSGIYNQTGRPTGTVDLYQGATLIGSTTLTTPSNNYTGTAVISWNPILLGQVDAGPKSMTVIYSGNDWNKAKTTTSTNVFEAFTRVAPITPVLTYSDPDIYTQPLSFVSDSSPSKPTGSITLEATSIQAFGIDLKVNRTFDTLGGVGQGKFITTSTAQKVLVSGDISTNGYQGRRPLKLKVYHNNILQSIDGTTSSYVMIHQPGAASGNPPYDDFDMYFYDANGTRKGTGDSDYVSFANKLVSLSSTGTVSLRVDGFESIPAVGTTLASITADALGVARFNAINLPAGKYSVKSNVPADVAYYASTSSIVTLERAPIVPYVFIQNIQRWGGGNFTNAGEIYFELPKVPEMPQSYVPNQFINLKVYYRWSLVGSGNPYTQGALFKSRDLPINGTGQPTRADASAGQLPYGYDGNIIGYFAAWDGYPDYATPRTITYSGQQYYIQGFYFEINYAGGGNVPASNTMTGYVTGDSGTPGVITGY